MPSGHTPGSPGSRWFSGKTAHTGIAPLFMERAVSLLALSSFRKAAPRGSRPGRSALWDPDFVPCYWS